MFVSPRRGSWLFRPLAHASGGGGWGRALLAAVYGRSSPAYSGARPVGSSRFRSRTILRTSSSRGSNGAAARLRAVQSMAYQVRLIRAALVIARRQADARGRFSPSAGAAFRPAATRDWASAAGSSRCRNSCARTAYFQPLWDDVQTSACHRDAPVVATLRGRYAWATGMRLPSSSMALRRRATDHPRSAHASSAHASGVDRLLRGVRGRTAGVRISSGPAPRPGWAMDPLTRASFRRAPRQ